MLDTCSQQSSRRVEFTMPQPMWDELERKRGLVPRAAFIKNALKVVLKDDPRAFESREDVAA